MRGRGGFVPFTRRALAAFGIKRQARGHITSRFFFAPVLTVPTVNINLFVKPSICQAENLTSVK
jgi:hypothetical protein